MNLGEFVHGTAVTCPPEATLAEVARIMREHDVGSVMVVDEHGHLVGVVTDRDVTVRGVARDMAPTVEVDAVMSPDVAWAYENVDVIDAATQMCTTGFRRLPVLDSEGHLKGVVALDDLAALFINQTGKLVRVLGLERPIAGSLDLVPTSPTATTPAMVSG